MVGAVGVALGIEYDRSGVFTFLVPGVVGIIILFASWVSGEIQLRLLIQGSQFNLLKINYTGW